MPASAIELKGALLSARQLVGLRDADGRDLAMRVAAVDGLPDSFRVLAPCQSKRAVSAICGELALDNNHEARSIAAGS